MIMAKDDEGVKDDEEEEMEQKRMKLSFFSAGGLTQTNMMKLQGKKILVLINSGTSHNFISTTLVEEFELKVE